MVGVCHRGVAVFIRSLERTRQYVNDSRYLPATARSSSSNSVLESYGSLLTIEPPQMLQLQAALHEVRQRLATVVRREAMLGTGPVHTVHGHPC